MPAAAGGLGGGPGGLGRAEQRLLDGSRGWLWRDCRSAGFLPLDGRATELNFGSGLVPLPAAGPDREAWLPVAVGGRCPRPSAAGGRRAGWRRLRARFRHRQRRLVGGAVRRGLACARRPPAASCRRAPFPVPTSAPRRAEPLTPRHNAFPRWGTGRPEQKTGDQPTRKRWRGPQLPRAPPVCDLLGSAIGQNKDLHGR